MHQSQASLDSTGVSALISSSPLEHPLSPAPSSPSSPAVSSDRRTPNVHSDISGSDPSDSPFRGNDSSPRSVQHTSSFTGSEVPSDPHPPLSRIASDLQLPAARTPLSQDTARLTDDALRRVANGSAGGSPSPKGLRAIRVSMARAQAQAEGEVEMEPDRDGERPTPQAHKGLDSPAPLGSDARVVSAGGPYSAPPAAFSEPLPVFDGSVGRVNLQDSDFLAIPMPLPLPVSPLQQSQGMARVGSPSIGGSVLFYPNSPSPRVRYATYGETRKRPSKASAARSGALFGAGHLVACCLLLLGATLFVLSAAYQSFYFRRMCDSGLNRCVEQRIGLVSMCAAVASPANGPYSPEVCDQLSTASDYSSNPGFQLVNTQLALIASAASFAFAAGLLAGLRGLCKRCPSRSPLARWSALLANLFAVSAVTLGLCGVLLHGEAAIDLGAQHSACAGSSGLCSVSVRLGWVSTVAFVALAVVLGGWATLAATSAAVIGSRWHDGQDGAKVT